MVWRTSSSADEVTVQVLRTTRSARGALGRGIEPLGREQRFQSRAIGLRGPAAEIVDKICPHKFIIGVGGRGPGAGEASAAGLRGATAAP